MSSSPYENIQMSRLLLWFDYSLSLTGSYIALDLFHTALCSGAQMVSLELRYEQILCFSSA